MGRLAWILILGLGLVGCDSSVTRVVLDQPPDDLPIGVHWRRKPETIRAVHFTTPTIGWAVGDSGAVLNTTDGSNWTEQWSGTSQDLVDVHFADSLNGCAVALYGNIVVTHDGGERWERAVTPDDISRLRAVHLLDDHGWIVGDDGVMLSTVDRGATWKTHDNGFSDALYDVFFLDEQHGWAVGANGTILQTSNAGRNWTRQDSQFEGSLHAVFFLDASHGWAVGDSGTILTYSANGDRWLSQTVDGTSLVSVGFQTASQGWVADDSGVMWRTDNGGADWNEFFVDLDPSVDGVEEWCFIDDRHGWAVGPSGIWATDDGGETWWAHLHGFQGHLSSIHFVDDRTGWAVGRDQGIEGENYAILARTSDGGQTWTVSRPISESDSCTLNDIYFVDDSVGWALGHCASTFDSITDDQTDILSTTNGGSSWTPQQHDSQHPLNDIYFHDDEIGWIVGAEGIVLATVNGGQEWTLQRTNVTANLRSVMFVDDQRGWAVGTNGVILSTNDGGATWGEQASGTTTTLNDVYFVDASAGWAVGEEGVILHTRDGDHWHQQPSLQIGPLMGVCFLNRSTGWAVGFGARDEHQVGVILTTTTGGDSWSLDRVPAVEELSSVSFPRSGQHVWIATEEYYFTTAEFKPAFVVKSVSTGQGAYITEFQAQDDLNSSTLHWRVEDEDPKSVAVKGMEFRQGSEGDWREITLPEMKLNEQNQFKLTWDPSAPRYGVRDGTELFYRVTLEDGEGITHRQQIATATGNLQGFVYRPWWDRQPPLFKGSLYAVSIIGAYVLGCLILLWTSPLSLIYLNRLIPLHEVTESLTPSNPAKLLIRISLQASGLSALTHHRRTRQAWMRRYSSGHATFGDLDQSLRREYLSHTDCLDAWVERHADQARESLDRIQTVNQRRIYIPLPIRIDKVEAGQRIPDPNPTQFRRFFEKSPTTIAIIGAGGTGKSTLACELARWALADHPDERISPHRMIPIIIEQDTDDLMSLVPPQLRQMVGNDEVDDELVENLLRHQRLLVIIDALSERSEATQQHVASLHGRCPINALVVTSRRRPDFGAAAVTELWPEQIKVETLLFFLTEYLRRNNADDLFPGRAGLKLADRLMALVEAGAQRLIVTPLLIRIFVDNAIALRKQGEAIETLPLSVAETMLEFLRRTNPQGTGTPNALPNETVVQAARILAWCSLANDYVPRDFFSDDAESALDATAIDVAGANAIRRLIDNGVIDERNRGGTTLLRFGLDSLAEYLAALYWLNQLRGAETEQWRTWFNQLQAVVGYPESMRGFLMAVEDCVTTYRQDFGIPEVDFPWNAFAASSEEA